MRSRLKTLMTASMAALLLLATQASPVHADSILNFSFDNSPSVTATVSGSTTTLVTTGGTPGVAGAQAINIGLLNGSTVDIASYVTLTATSVGAAVSSFGQIIQEFNGSFAITANANGSGTNYLSGTFTNLSFDSTLSGHGSEASLSASDPTATITLSSAVITSLYAPSATSFTFTNVSPSLAITGSGPTATIAPFTASGSGTFSASPAPVPEPSTMAIAGLGALGMIGYGLRRRKALGV